MKKNTLLYIETTLVEKAKTQNINISRLAEDALRKALDMKKPQTPKEYLQMMLKDAESEDPHIGDIYYLPFQIESLALNKIGPFRKFEANFNRDAVSIIYGPNGSGKSIILRAILFAFGRKHRYFDGRVLNGGTIKLKIFPNQTSVSIENNQRLENPNKGFKCLLADAIFEVVPREMTIPLLHELKSLGIQVVLTSVWPIDPEKLPRNINIVSLENYPRSRLDKPNTGMD